VLTSLCGDDWSSDEFRKTMLPLLASTSKGEDETFRIDHDSLREFFIGLLDAPEATARKLADALCRWPASSSEFARRYALRHGLRHWRELGEWDRFATLALDARYLDAFCSEVGMVALNAELDATFAAVGDRAPRQLCTLRQFVNARVDDCDLWESLDRPMGQDFYAWCVLEGICAAGTLNHFTPPRILMRGGAVRPSARLVLRGHSDAIAACALVGDGRRALSASKDGTLRVWNVERGEVVRVLKGHSSPVTACALVGDGRRALSLSEEGTILGWDLENGASILRLDTGLEYSYVCFSGDGKRVVLGSGLGTLRLWDLEKGKCSHLLETGLPASRPFAISRDGKRVLWSSIHAKVWDVETGLSNAVVEEGSTLVATYEVLGGDQRALLRNEGKLQVWDLENGETIGSLNSFHQSAKWAINGDGKLAVSAGDDGWVVVWDLEKGERCSWRHYCWERVLMCTVAGGGGIAMIADEEGSIGVWDLETHRNILKVREPGLTACAMTRSGTRLLTGSVDGTLRVWDLKTASTHRFHGHPEPVRACAATGNGNRALTLSEDGTLRVWDLEERKCVDWLDGQPQNVTALAASAGGRRALLGSNDGTLRVWDLDERKCVHLLIGDSHDINACAISGDELRALSVSWDGTLRVWDLEKGICIHTLKGGGRDTWHCAMSKDGRRAMTGSKVGTLRVWDLEQGKRLHTLKCGSRSITACAMIGEGRQAWSASQDGTIRVWDLERGERLHTLRGHTRSVWMCAMTGDAGQALSASDDGLRVWDLKNGECIRTLAVDAVWGAATCAVNGDGRHAVSASGPDMLQWWDLASGTLLHSFKGTAPFLQLSTCDNGTIIAGDLDGNVWILEVDSGLWPRTPA
jgi:WD40 repeat protein